MEYPRTILYPHGRRPKDPQVLPSIAKGDRTTIEWHARLGEEDSRVEKIMARAKD